MDTYLILALFTLLLLLLLLLVLMPMMLVLMHMLMILMPMMLMLILMLMLLLLPLAITTETQMKNFLSLFPPRPVRSLRDLPNINALWGALVVEELVRLGVRHFCVCPGSRSAPLAVAIARYLNYVSLFFSFFFAKPQQFVSELRVGLPRYA